MKALIVIVGFALTLPLTAESRRSASADASPWTWTETEREYRRIVAETERLKIETTRMKRIIAKSAKEKKEMAKVLGSVGEREVISDLAAISKLLPDEAMLSDFRWNENEIGLTIRSEKENLDLSVIFAPLRRWKVSDVQHRNPRLSSITIINAKLIPAAPRVNKRGKYQKRRDKIGSGSDTSVVERKVSGEDERKRPENLEQALMELKKRRAEYDKVHAKYDELAQQRKRYREICGSAWKNIREDQVKNKLHDSVSLAAAKLEFKPSRIGAVNIGKLNNELYYADVDIAAEGKLDEVVNLIMAMEDIRPAPVWKQLVIRPDNRPRPQTSSTDSLNFVNQARPPERTRVMMSGTLRVIYMEESSGSDKKGSNRK